MKCALPVLWRFMALLTAEGDGSNALITTLGQGRSNPPLAIFLDGHRSQGRQEAHLDTVLDLVYCEDPTLNSSKEGNCRSASEFAFRLVGSFPS